MTVPLKRLLNICDGAFFAEIAHELFERVLNDASKVNSKVKETRAFDFIMVNAKGSSPNISANIERI